MTFNDFTLSSEIIKAVRAKGYDSPTPIQQKAIPAVLEGRDVLAGAQTGTGKTAAFALPVLELLNREGKKEKAPRVLILTPTRELAAQVGESFIDYGKNLPFRTEIIFGGVKINPQIQRLKDGCDILVATPGRLLDHVSQKTLDLSRIKYLILDEADRMLDMGFIRDIKKVISCLPSARQNLMFSATYGKEIKALCNSLLHNPVTVEVRQGNKTADKVEQIAYRTEKNQKRHLLSYLIKKESWYQVLVFVKTKHGANRLAKQLTRGGIPSSALHGDKSQNARIRALKEFKEGDLQALIATNVAARGLDLQGLDYVVNYDLPQMAEDYVHRIGRTGRAGESGQAITFITPEDRSQLKSIEKLIGDTIPVTVPEGFVPVIEQENPGRGANQRSRRTGS
nr:DEAD/DEAH box helicase [uncultured Sphaerochaeta sp.]